MRFSREIPVKMSVDVCVVGGGPAGAAAAITAARNGASVFLAEGMGCLGGLGTSGGVPVFMTFTDGVNFCADGVGREIKERLNENCDYGHEGRCFNHEKFKRVYDDLCEEAGVRVSFFTEFIGAETVAGNVACAVFNAKSGIFAIEAKIFIDCSGDADLVARAGGEYMYGDASGAVMPSTLCSHWAGINWKQWYTSGTDIRDLLAKAFKENVFRNNDPHHTGICPTGDHLGGGNMGHLFGLNPLDEASLTAGMIEGRRQSVEFQNFYRAYVPGYQEAELTFTSSLMGVRASRRAVGDYILTIDDYRARRVFDDEIGRYCYPIDIHPASPEQADQEEFRHLIHDLAYKPGESYGLPYRMLTVKGFGNLLTAGRCASSDCYMQASIRTMPGCYVMGQAAGMAAAMASAADCGVRDIATAELQKNLKKAGAFLPNFKG